MAAPSSPTAPMAPLRVRSRRKKSDPGVRLRELSGGSQKDQLIHTGSGSQSPQKSAGATAAPPRAREQRWQRLRWSVVRLTWSITLTTCRPEGKCFDSACDWRGLRQRPGGSHESILPWIRGAFCGRHPAAFTETRKTRALVAQARMPLAGDACFAETSTGAARHVR